MMLVWNRALRSVPKPLQAATGNIEIGDDTEMQSWTKKEQGFCLRFEITRTVIIVIFAIVGTKNDSRATILAWSAKLGRCGWGLPPWGYEGPSPKILNFEALCLHFVQFLANLAFCFSIGICCLKG